MQCHIGEAVSLLKTMVEKDPAKEFIRFMQDETEKSRKHELEMAKLILNVTTSDQHEERASETHSIPGGQYHLNAFNFQHHQIPPTFHTPPASTESFDASSSMYPADDVNYPADDVNYPADDVNYPYHNKTIYYTL